MSNENQESEQSTSLVKITHYGTIHIGLIDIECMVTEKTLKRSQITLITLFCGTPCMYMSPWSSNHSPQR